MRIIVDSKESAKTKQACEMLLNAEILNLSEGDFVIDDENGTKWTVERKTWSDAYSSWQSKRLQEQVSRMVEKCQNYILLIEGSWTDVYAEPDRIKGLQVFFNRMCVEVCPVIYTESFDETVRYLRSLSLRVKDETVNTLVRPVTVVTSTRNKHHAMLEQIPRVGRTTAKKIHEGFADMKDFVNNWEDAPARGVAKGVAWQAIDDFINTVWSEVVQQVIIKKE